jgi:hypothetical protein
MKTLMDSSFATVIFYNNQDPYGGLDIRNGVQTKYRFSKHILLIVGYEDLNISDYYESCHFISQSYLKAVKSLKLIIIRDLRNITASRLNHAHMANNLKHSLEIQEQTKELWKDHHNVFGDSSYNIIRYNNLINDLNKMHLNSFFIQNLRESKKILNRYGGGSSFVGEQFNSRYLKFEKDKTFLALLSGLGEQDQLVHGPW